ncbi:MAG: LysM domain-containing protein, partial [Tumebacillaceae bacterium]
MKVHSVQKGDTLWKISKLNGISLEALIAANPQIPNPDQIDVGMQVNIPDGTPAAPAPASPGMGVELQAAAEAALDLALGAGAGAGAAPLPQTNPETMTPPPAQPEPAYPS